MQRKTIIISFLIVALLIGWGLIKLFQKPPSDLLNTNRIFVKLNETGEVREITNKSVIKKIVNVAIKKEKEGLNTYIDEPYTYSLEFFTKDTGYGPLLCYKDLGICRFEADTMGNYIDVSKEFFRWIEEGI